MTAKIESCSCRRGNRHSAHAGDLAVRERLVPHNQSLTASSPPERSTRLARSRQSSSSHAMPLRQCRRRPHVASTITSSPRPVAPETDRRTSARIRRGRRSDASGATRARELPDATASVPRNTDFHTWTPTHTTDKSPRSTLARENGSRPHADVDSRRHPGREKFGSVATTTICTWLVTVLTEAPRDEGNTG